MTGRAAQGMERCGANPPRRIPRGPDLTPSFSPGRATLFSVPRCRAVVLLLAALALLAILFAAPCATARATVIERTGADWTLAAPAGTASPSGPAAEDPASHAPLPAGPVPAVEPAHPPRGSQPVSPWQALHPAQGSHPPQGPHPSQGPRPALPSHGAHGIFVPDPEAQP